MGKVRTQVQLEREQLDSLREMARREGISLSQAIRRIIDAHFGEGQPATGPPQAALDIIGSGRDPCPDVAVHHDRYLAGSD